MALASSGCDRSRVRKTDGASLSQYHRMAVLAFTDPRGKGPAIADAITAGLPQLMYEQADNAKVAAILKAYKPDPETGISLEAFERIRLDTGADAIAMGRMAPDWSGLRLDIVETETGEPVLRAALTPRGQHRRAFETPDEVAAEVLRVLADRR